MSPPEFAVVVPIGPGPAELARTADLLDSLWHYEPGVSTVVLVDDRRDGLAGLRIDPPSGCIVRVLDNPRRGRGSGYGGGMSVGLIAAFGWTRQSTDARFVVKLDTDTLVIASFAEAVDVTFATRPDVGQVGTLIRRHEERQTLLPPVAKRIATNIRRLRGGAEAARRVAARAWQFLRGELGTSHRLRRRVREAEANGYVIGEHCQGGAYALSRDAIDRLAKAGDLRRPLDWLWSPVPEDVTVSMLVRAANLRCAAFDGNGEPFSSSRVDDGRPGLALSPGELVQRGSCLIHPVKGPFPLAEVAIRQYFRDRRRMRETGKDI